MLRFWRLAAIALLGLAVLHAPTHAHENHLQAQIQQQSAGAAQAQATPPDDREAQEAAARAALPWPERLLDWLGRLHPSAVHFPIALAPASLLALLLARRRGEGAELVRILTILAGASAVIAAALGWLDGGIALTDSNPIKLWHRWTGTGLALAGAALAFLVWRRRIPALGGWAAIVLALMTLTLIAQGWLGGALVHGAGHLDW